MLGVTITAFHVVHHTSWIPPLIHVFRPVQLDIGETHHQILVSLATVQDPQQLPVKLVLVEVVLNALAVIAEPTSTQVAQAKLVLLHVQTDGTQIHLV
jgi:hypothetical protein